MLGKPKYKVGDEIIFKIKPYEEEKEIECVGKVYIIDAYGTFEQNEEPSYDVMVEDWRDTGEPMLVKHLRESGLESWIQ